MNEVTELLKKWIEQQAEIAEEIRKLNTVSEPRIGRMEEMMRQQVEMLASIDASMKELVRLA